MSTGGGSFGEVSTKPYSWTKKEKTSSTNWWHCWKGDGRNINSQKGM